MESLKHYTDQGRLTTLTDLAKRVEDFQALCLPDFIYSEEETRDLGFIEIDLSKHLGGHLDMRAAISMQIEGASMPYAFTRWSRGQLLSHLGTRERWFETVSRAQEVSELNVRLHALRGYKLRTMRSFDSPDMHIVRGIVSLKYADLPDVTIMKSLTELMPNGYAVSSFSGKTDRAFYAYAITEEAFSIPGTSFRGYPGVVLKNSEVGYTSLWVIPMMYMADRGVPVVLKKHAVLRRIHRGNVVDLTEKFSTALKKTTELWSPLKEKLAALGLITYPTEDAALAVIRALLESAGSERLFIHRCELSYSGAANSVHSALTVFNAVLANIKIEEGQDDAYVSAELAGAVLMSLLK